MRELSSAHTKNRQTDETRFFRRSFLESAQPASRPESTVSCTCNYHAAIVNAAYNALKGMSGRGEACRAAVFRSSVSGRRKGSSRSRSRREPRRRSRSRRWGGVGRGNCASAEFHGGLCGRSVPGPEGQKMAEAAEAAVHPQSHGPLFRPREHQLQRWSSCRAQPGGLRLRGSPPGRSAEGKRGKRDLSDSTLDSPLSAESARTCGRSHQPRQPRLRHPALHRLHPKRDRDENSIFLAHHQCFAGYPLRFKAAHDHKIWIN